MSLADLEVELRTILKRQTLDIVEAGRILIKIRESDEIKHGDWLPWLAKNFDLSDRTARRWIAVAEYVDGKSDTMSNLLPNLAPGVLYQLAAGTYGDEFERKILAAAKTKRIDIDGAQAIKQKVADAEAEKFLSEGSGAPVTVADTEETEVTAEDTEGSPPDLPPPDLNQEICNELDTAVEQLTQALQRLNRLTTKKLASFAASTLTQKQINAAIEALGSADRIRGFLDQLKRVVGASQPEQKKEAA